MKSKKITRILGIALIISLLVLVIPASHTLAAYDMVLSPSSGQIGDTIYITGTNFPVSTVIYFCFSSQSVLNNTYIGTDVTVYSTVTSTTTTATGTLNTSFVVPAKFSTNNADVTTGLHYLYATVFTADVPPKQLIVNSISFNIVGGEISIDPEEGTVDTEIEITGTDFAPNQDITIEFDGDEVDIEDGDDETDSNGEFVSWIYVPEATTGIKDIDVTVAGYTVTAEFTMEPMIFLSAQSGKVGDVTTISGSGFGRRQYITIYFNNNPFPQSIRTGTNGSFDVSFEIPDLGLSQGTYYIEVEDEDFNSDSVPFTLNVTPPTTTPPTTTPPTTTPPPDNSDLSISSSGDTIGSLIGIGGTGFTPNGTAIVKYDGEEVATITIESTGAFLVTFQVPPSVGGDHVITVTDGINTAETTFTVETTAPEIPPPLAPAMGARISSPFSFDWEDVTDESSPVTYALQISGTPSFNQASILVDKPALTSSQYELTEQEGLNLAGREAPYYWRVKAIDAASNESDWSGIGEFYVAPPFSFPTWAIIILAVFGALILFGVGYWLGRRTAFFY